MTRIVAAVSLVISLGLARLDAQCPDGSPPPCAPSAVRVSAPNSVAVLYFDNLSHDSNDVYLADGLTEEIISRLGSVERLVVKSRNAVQRYRDRATEDPSVLGRALGVVYLVSGSVQRAGPRVRVRVELVKAAAGTHLWGRTFDSSERDLLVIEDTVAQTVAGEVIGRLAPSERTALTRRPTDNMGAYDHYLKGNFYLSRRTSGADIHQALKEYRSALVLDPVFTGALGRMGLAYGLLGNGTYPGSERDSLLRNGFAAADRAIGLDSMSVDGWLARGFLLAPRPDCPRGVPDCVRLSLEATGRALRLAPRDAEVLHQHGRSCLTAGRFTVADSVLQAALELEPDRAETAWLLGRVYLFERRFERARQMVDSAIALGMTDLYTYNLRMDIKVAQSGGNLTQADLDSARTWLLPDSVSYTAKLILAEARRGDSTSARARVDTLARRLARHDEHDLSGVLVLAASYIAVGSFDQALTLLEGLPRYPAVWLWLQYPTWDAVRQDPRFRHIEEEVRPRN